MKRFIAFTLAEVLITLGIIGIVVAMTMPTLIGQYQKYVLKQQFKQAYTIVSQFLLKAEAELGYSPECYYPIKDSSSVNINIIGEVYTSECKLLEDIFIENVNIVKYCKNKAYKNGCIPKYIGSEKIAMDKNPDLSEEDALDEMSGYIGWSTDYILNKNSAYVLNDSYIIMPYRSIFLSNFLIDINGKKGPNKWGYDLFTFHTFKNSSGNLILGAAGYTVEKGGLTTAQMIKQMHYNK